LAKVIKTKAMHLQFVFFRKFICSDFEKLEVLELRSILLCSKPFAFQ